MTDKKVSREGMLEWLGNWIRVCKSCGEKPCEAACSPSDVKQCRQAEAAIRALIDDVERWKQEAKSIIAESDQDIIDGFDTTNDYYLRLESFVDEFQNYTYGGKEEK